MAGSTSHFVTAQDGLRLHLREYGPRGVAALPVVCLPGLARTGADFDELATSLAGDAEHPRRVTAIDYRGRGLSDYDRNPKNYSVTVELADILSILAARGIERAVFIGTSRGGILAMLLALARPTAVAGVVLNDIGPVIETQGLVRIKSYVGRLPQPKSFAEAAIILRRVFESQFPKLSDGDWMAWARRSFFEKADGKLVATYDVKLARTLKGLRLERALPPLWREFDALGDIPLMVVRGANSDILSAATVTAMRSRRPDIEVIDVPDQGHAPLLTDDDTVGCIRRFIASCPE